MRRTLLLAAVLATASLASAQLTVKTIVSNGNSSNRYDIVILGDGYQATEQAKFDSDCVAVANALPTVKELAHVVTAGARGAGVTELIDLLISGEVIETRTPDNAAPPE